MDDHQINQLKVINQIEYQLNNNALDFTTVSHVEDYLNDQRMALTSVHLPNKDLAGQIKQIIDRLRKVEPNYYYYPDDLLHMTIKNIRVVNDPPHFNKSDIFQAEKVFSEVVPKHKKFSVYFYRLLLFPSSLCLVGTTDSELDNIIFDLDKKLKQKGVADDKIYINKQFFFSNITLCRFPKYSKVFARSVSSLQQNVRFDPYKVDSITLLVCNAVLQKRNVINSWRLRDSNLLEMKKPTPNILH